MSQENCSTEPVGKEVGSSQLSHLFSNTRSEDEMVQLEWKNIYFSTIMKNKIESTLLKPVMYEKVILDGVSGSIMSGQLLAIMGPTGILIYLTCLNLLIFFLRCRMWKDLFIEYSCCKSSIWWL